MGRVSRILKSPIRPAKPLLPGALNPIRSRYVDEDLGRVVAAWHQLPQHIRLAILALAETAERKCERTTGDAPVETPLTAHEPSGS